LSSELLKVRRSRIHPLAASVAVALIASSITLEREVLGSLPVMATSLVLALLTVRRASLIAVWALRFLPMGLGLGAFAFLASGGKQIELVPLLLVRVETMVMGSMLLAYGVESWELAYSLRSLGLPGWFSSSIGIAHVLLKEVPQGARRGDRRPQVQGPHRLTAPPADEGRGHHQSARRRIALLRREGLAGAGGEGLRPGGMETDQACALPLLGLVGDRRGGIGLPDLRFTVTDPASNLNRALEDLT